MGNCFLNMVCPCLPNKTSVSHQSQIKFHEQHPKIKEEELIQPLLATQANEYRSLNTVDPNLYSNLDDLRLKPSNFVLLNKKHPSEVYTQIGDIGEGSYGSIIKVKHKLTGEIRAMKIIQKRRMAYGVNEQKILEEIKILKSLDHPNIIKIFEFFVDKINFYIVMEYSDQGDLFNFISKSRFLKEKTICSIIKQIMSAVAYLHSKNIIHGDIKLENILIDTIHRENNITIKQSPKSNININKLETENTPLNTCESKLKDNDKSIYEQFDVHEQSSNPNEFVFNYSDTSSVNINYDAYNNYNTIVNIEVKIIDFGCSKYFLPNEIKSDIVGTAYYVAPEVLNQEYNNKCDLWSVGVIMYTLMNGKPPFGGRSQSEILTRVAKGEYDLSSKRFEKASKESKDLLVQLLRYNYKARPSAYQALGHIWFNCEERKSIVVSLNNEDRLAVTNAIYKLKKFSVKSKFEQAVLTIITHNISESIDSKKRKKVFTLIDYDSDGRISPDDLMHTIQDIKATNNINTNNNNNQSLMMNTQFDNSTTVVNKLAVSEYFQGEQENGIFNSINLSPQELNSNLQSNLIIQNNRSQEENNNNANGGVSLANSVMMTVPLNENYLKILEEVVSINHEDLSNIMKNVDYDKNGYIEFEEFLKATIDKSIMLSQKNLIQAFELFFLGESFNEKSPNSISTLDRSMGSKEIQRTIFGGTSYVKKSLTQNIMEEVGKKFNETINFEEFVKLMGS